MASYGVVIGKVALAEGPALVTRPHQKCVQSGTLEEEALFFPFFAGKQSIDQWGIFSFDFLDLRLKPVAVQGGWTENRATSFFKGEMFEAPKTQIDALPTFLVQSP